MGKLPYYGGGKMKETFEIVYFEKDDSDCPVENFLHSLNKKMAAKAYRVIAMLSEYGNGVAGIYSKHLDDGIFELRIKEGSNIGRVMYFFYYNKTIVLTNGFIKKTQKTPKRELETAKKYRAIFLERMDKNGKEI